MISDHLHLHTDHHHHRCSSNFFNFRKKKCAHTNVIPNYSGWLFFVSIDILHNIFWLYPHIKPIVKFFFCFFSFFVLFFCLLLFYCFTNIRFLFFVVVIIIIFFTNEMMNSMNNYFYPILSVQKHLV